MQWIEQTFTEDANMTLHIAVCDDEKSVREQVCTLLLDFSSTYPKLKCHTTVFTNGEELMQSDKFFDLIFVDIEMGGIDGIQAARAVRKNDRKVALIYITNHPEYALKTFAVHPFDFIPKPIDKPKFFATMTEFIKYTRDKAQSEMLEFKKSSGKLFLNASDVYYFEYVANRTIVAVTKHGNKEIKGNIKDILPILEGHGFFSPHKSCIISLAYVKESDKHDIQMCNGATVPLASRRKSDFQKSLINFYHDSLL